VAREVKREVRMVLLLSIYDVRACRFRFIRVGAGIGALMDSKSSFEI
jgi:hypothetical protein